MRNLLLLTAIAGVMGFGSYVCFGRASDSSEGKASLAAAPASVSVGVEEVLAPGVDNDAQVPYLAQWAAQSEYRYSLEYSTSVNVVGGERFIDLSFKAELAIARAQSGSDHLVKAQWSKIALQGQPRDSLRPEVAAFLDNLTAPVIGRYRADGELVAVHAAPRIEAPVFGLLSYVLAELQLQAPSDHQVDWQGEELDFIGRYVAHYRRMGGGQVWRSHRRYQKLHEGMIGTVAKLDHTVKFSFGDDGVPSLFDSDANLVNRSDAGETRGITKLRATYLATGPADFSAVPADFATFPIKPLSAGSTPQRLAPREPASALASAMRTQPGDMSGHFAAKAQLAARIRDHADEIPQVISAIRSALDGHESARLIAALTEAGTPESAQAIAELARDKTADLALRRQAVSQLGIAENPTAHSARELSALADDTGLEDEVRRSATLGLGANLRNAPEGAIAQDEREAFQGKLVEQASSAPAPADRRAAISALGNAGTPGALPALQNGLASPLPTERSSAVYALRYIPTPEAEQQILDTLANDPAPVVRSSAAEALASRPTRTEAAASALVQALGTEQELSVQRSLLVPMPFYLPSYPELRRWLAALAERSSNAELKRDIERLLRETPLQSSE